MKYVKINRCVEMTQIRAFFAVIRADLQQKTPPACGRGLNVLYGKNYCFSNFTVPSNCFRFSSYILSQYVPVAWCWRVIFKVE